MKIDQVKQTGDAIWDDYVDEKSHNSNCTLKVYIGRGQPKSCIKNQCWCEYNAVSCDQGPCPVHKVL